MSVVIRDGIGRDVLCKSCKHPIVLSSRTEYKCCENCGFENDLSPKYHWSDNMPILVIFLCWVAMVVLYLLK